MNRESGGSTNPEFFGTIVSGIGSKAIGWRIAGLGPSYAPFHWKFALGGATLKTRIKEMDRVGVVRNERGAGNGRYL